MNRIEVFSTVDQTRIGQITVPAASSVDLAPDGATLWVGTVTQQVVAIDTASLQVRARYPIRPLAPVPNSSFDRPEERLVLSNGNCLLRVRQSSGVQSLPALWNPATNSLTNLAAVLPRGLGVMARTADHNKSSSPLLIPVASSPLAIRHGLARTPEFSSVAPGVLSRRPAVHSPPSPLINPPAPTLPLTCALRGT